MWKLASKAPDCVNLHIGGSAMICVRSTRAAMKNASDRRRWKELQVGTERGPSPTGTRRQ
eukprot:scaffold179589_cov30-Tisochrysis_lutea.AAC.3